jgi:hypothetical protein
MSNAAFYEKQMILDRLGLPSDIVREIKYLCFDEKISGESKKIKKRSVAILRTALSREYSEERNYYLPDIVYNINGIIVSHWAYGFGYDQNERIQLQAINCLRCGNYHMFNHIENNPHSPSILCNCEIHIDDNNDDNIDDNIDDNEFEYETTHYDDDLI